MRSKRILVIFAFNFLLALAFSAFWIWVAIRLLMHFGVI